MRGDIAGSFLAVGGFSFFDGIDFGGSGKPKYGGFNWAVMHYGGNCLAMMKCGGNLLAERDHSFSGGNVSVNTNLTVIAVPS